MLEFLKSLLERGIEVLSILYLRCDFSSWTAPSWRELPFNSLFEMLTQRLNATRGANATFNSLFEMPLNYRRVGGAFVFEPFNSLFEMHLAGVAGAGLSCVYFQFSI